MAWLPEGGKILKICLLVLTECPNVTDGQTHRHRMTAKAALDRAAKTAKITNGEIIHHHDAYVLLSKVTFCNFYSFRSFMSPLSDIN